jgi:CubicO group peptidase (beta-lactamase class C family)
MNSISFLLPLALLLGCAGVSEPKKPIINEKGDYSYVKEYMKWYISRQMKEKDIVGLSIAFVDDQKIVWQEGFGYANKKNKVKATPQTLYRAGSVTKLFNAMAVMKLKEENRIDIDKPFKIYLPSFSIKSRFGSTDNITPRNIMTHHSGLPSEWIDKMFATNPLHYSEHKNLIHNEYVAYPPNTILSYSNLGITLLGDAVENVSGVKYDKFLSKILLSPLQMENSNINSELSGLNSSKSYINTKEVKEYPLGMLPAGALNTTVEDLSHLAMMINANGKYNNQNILEPDSLQEMFRVQNKNVALDLGEKIGLGCFIDNKSLNRETIYHHAGATIGHRSIFMITANSKLGVVIMANSSSADVTKIGTKLLEKALELKTGKKSLNKKETTVYKDYNLEGTYATMVGKVLIKNKSNNKYYANTQMGDFVLNKSKNNSYKAKYRLFGFISIGDEELDQFDFYMQKIENKHLLIASIGSEQFIAGEKIKRVNIPNAWDKYQGKYEVLNNLEPEIFKIDTMELKIENGYLLSITRNISGKTNIITLNPINNTEAIVEGLGRGMQETIYFKDGIFNFQGLKFKRINKE